MKLINNEIDTKVFALGGLGEVGKNMYCIMTGSEIIITDAGMVMRMPLDQISVLGRVTQGVRLINLKDDHTVATISLVDKEKEEEIPEETVENVEVINSDNSDIVELAEREIAAAEENENSEVNDEAADENLEVSEN